MRASGLLSSVKARLHPLDLPRPVSAKIFSLAHATEDADKVIRAILNICPTDTVPKVRTTKVKGHYGNPIVTIQLVLAGSPRVERLFDHLWKNLLDSDKSHLYQSVESQLNKSGVLHIRIDKQSALRGIILMKEDDPIKVEILFRRGDRQQSTADQVKKTMDLLSKIWPRHCVPRKSSDGNVAIY